LSVEQWADVDPDNAFPWLLVARAAHHRKDARAFRDAVARAARATSFQRHSTRYGDVLAAVDVRYRPVRALVVHRLAAAHTRDDPADYFSNFQVVGRYCASKDSGRREVCGDLGRVLFQRSRDALGMQIGQVIVRALFPRPGSQLPDGWLAANDYNIELAALYRASADVPDCRTMVKTERWLRAVAANREVEYLGERVAHWLPPFTDDGQPRPPNARVRR
jgi:hypothetical protein